MCRGLLAARARLPFATTTYEADKEGVLRPVLPSRCVYATGAETCSPSDAVNLQFARAVMGEGRLVGGGIVCRAPNSFPLAGVFRALPPTEIG